MPDIEERFWQPYKDQAFQIVALNPRESTTQAGMVQSYIENLRVTFPAGIEEPATTYTAVTTNFPGPNPFPSEVIVGKDGIVRYIDHEYDPDAMAQVIQQLLTE